MSEQTEVVPAEVSLDGLQAVMQSIKKIVAKPKDREKFLQLLALYRPELCPDIEAARETLKAQVDDAISEAARAAVAQVEHTIQEANEKLATAYTRGEAEWEATKRYKLNNIATLEREAKEKIEQAEAMMAAARERDGMDKPLGFLRDYLEMAGHIRRDRYGRMEPVDSRAMCHASIAMAALFGTNPVDVKFGSSRD